MSLLIPLYGWISIECDTQGHGRCTSRECSCDCHAEYAALETLQQMANRLERRIEHFAELVCETLGKTLETKEE